MEKTILKTNSITKIYGRNKVLSNVSVDLKQGHIYGLIGQNGAGKTTLMRIIAGLSFQTRGDMILFGKNKNKEIQKARKQISCMIENPSLNPNMTASDNLKLRRLTFGIKNSKLDKELLELVGLNDTKSRKVKDFSLGMKQRLGIAMTLVNDPKFLILDEPINGLDPIGVVEIRKLIKKICKDKNITILISSHNLPELFQVATDYIIIHKGEVKQLLTTEELENNCQKYILLEYEDLPKLSEVLKTKLNTTNFEKISNKQIKLYDYVDDRKTLAKTLFEEKIIVTNLSLEGETLEDYFVSLVGGKNNG